MAEKTKKTVEEVIIAIEAHLAEIDSALLKHASDRAEDLKVMQNSVELLKADLDNMGRSLVPLMNV